MYNIFIGNCCFCRHQPLETRNLALGDFAKMSEHSGSGYPLELELGSAQSRSLAQDDRLAVEGGTS